MFSAENLVLTAKTRLDDAKALLDAERYDGAVYLCGYALEIALKMRITIALGLEGFPANKKESGQNPGLWLHDLDELLKLSGHERRIKDDFIAEWSYANTWKPELRYMPPDKTIDQANVIIESTEKLIT